MGYAKKGPANRACSSPLVFELGPIGMMVADLTWIRNRFLINEVLISGFALSCHISMQLAYILCVTCVVRRGSYPIDAFLPHLSQINVNSGEKADS